MKEIFKIDDKYLIQEFKFKKTDIKPLVTVIKTEIEIMFRPKLFLMQLDQYLGKNI